MRLCFLLLLLLPAVLGVTPAAGQRTDEASLLVLGDSLSAGYGIPHDSGWVPLLQRRLQAAVATRPWTVVNGSISGDTTRGGLSRLPAALARHHPGIVIVELGGNDGLRGVPVEETRHNLDAIVSTCQAARARVLLVGIRLPPNFGPQYTEALASLYRDVAKTHGIPLVPHLLQALGTGREDFQADGIHPVAAVQGKLLDTVWPSLALLLSHGARP